MMEYAPWSTDVLKHFSRSPNKLSILDIQFGGKCNLNCIYCDTPTYALPCSLCLDSIEKFVSSGTVQWVYGCGLGELTATGNIETLKQVLYLCKKYGTKVSIFSNVVNLDNELLDYIDSGTLHLLFKLDSFNPKVMNYLYGADKSNILIKNYAKLKEVVHINNGTTNLGASIVPTIPNYSDIFRVINFCMDYNIYPLLGQLEEAGRCNHLIFDELALTASQLISLKTYIEYNYDVKYQIPICPATIFGVHVTNFNNVIVDKKSGLSCGWFRLQSPEMITLGSIVGTSLEEITNIIIGYRKEMLPSVISEEKELKYNPFGGCGGDTKNLFNQYINIASTY